MARCAATTKAGNACKLTATHGSYCAMHHPELAEQRRDAAAKGGRAGGNGRAGTGALTELRRESRVLYAGIRSGKFTPAVGHAAVAALRVELKTLVTLDTYSHVIPGMGDQTAKAMEDVLS